MQQDQEETESGGDKKNRGWIEILPRCKIQYPMKNRCKDVV